MFRKGTLVWQEPPSVFPVDTISGVISQLEINPTDYTGRTFV